MSTITVVSVVLLGLGLACSVYFLAGWAWGTAWARSHGRSTGTVWQMLDVVGFHFGIFLLYLLTAYSWWAHGVPVLDHRVDVAKRMLFLILLTGACVLRAVRWSLLVHVDNDQSGVPTLYRL